MEWEDHKRIKEVKNPRLIETGYRSPQLTLWTLGPDEWLLFLKLPDYAARKKPQRKPDVIQLPLPDLDENQRQGSLWVTRTGPTLAARCVYNFQS